MSEPGANDSSSDDIAAAVRRHLDHHSRRYRVPLAGTLGEPHIASAARSGMSGVPGWTPVPPGEPLVVVPRESVDVTPTTRKSFSYTYAGR